jgi:general secretion pathway protein D
VPFVGNVFKHKDDQIGKAELIIMITPHVVRSTSEARRVTDEFRGELALSGSPMLREQRRMRQTVPRVIE